MRILSPRSGPRATPALAWLTPRRGNRIVSDKLFLQTHLRFDYDAASYRLLLSMNRIVVTYLASYATSLLGNSIAAIALPLVVLAATGSVLGAGVMALASGIPSVLGGLFGGVIIDRINRRTASIISDLISGISVAALPVIAMTVGLDLTWFIICSFLGALGDIPGLTAREAMLPGIVRKGNIKAETLVGIRESLGPLIMLIGPALAGILMLSLSGVTVLWITASTSFAAAIITALMPGDVGVIVDEGKEAEAKPKSTSSAVSKELREGFRFLLRGDRLVFGVLIINFALVATITAFQNLILPAHFTNMGLGGHAGFVLSAIGLGTLLGAAVYAGFGTRLKRSTWFTLGMIGTVSGFVAIALLLPTALIVAGGVIVGISTGPISALLGVMLIERIPENLRGRVMGTQNAILTIAPPVAVFSAALLSTWLGLAIAGLIFLAIWSACVIYAILGKAFRNLDDKSDAQNGEMDAN